MDLTILEKFGFPIAACAILCYAIKLLFSAYQDQIKARDAEQAAEIARLTAALAERK